MWSRLSLAALALVVGGASANHAGVINQLNGDIPVNSDMGRHLLSQARREADNNEYNYNNMDLSFLVGYSVKFQGCHHVQQWNKDADEEDDVRIKTKRLVRFRLCPVTDCDADTTGCTSKYGDYVVDMNTFVDSYLQTVADGSNCSAAKSTCYQTCGDDDECMAECYTNMGMDSCYGTRKLADFDPLDYTQCAQIDVSGGRRLDQYAANDDDAYGGSYYLGPYCADQGGEIHLGMFTDDTCTSFAQNGEDTFYQAMGFAIPYSDRSMVSQVCLSCGYSNDGEYALNDMCNNVYPIAGKCETRMNIDYPNESSCSYIEGIKIIREDGVIRTSATRKSKAAAVCIGVFLTVSVLLAGYVYYLRTKLGRARVNLSAASHTLT
jgi:hypothetical protein